MGQLVADDLGPAEHQQSSQPQTVVTRIPILAKGANAIQKLRQRKITPDVARLYPGKAITVGRDSLHVEVVEIKTLEHALIARVLYPLGQHAPHGLIVRLVVPVMAPQIGAPEWVTAQMHGLLLPRRTRYPNVQHGFAIDIDGRHVVLYEKIGADLLGVMEVVP